MRSEKNERERKMVQMRENQGEGERDLPKMDRGEVKENGWWE